MEYLEYYWNIIKSQEEKSFLSPIKYYKRITAVRENHINGDFNAKVGNEVIRRIDIFNKETINENGEQLIHLPKTSYIAI
jgi:hypothetical protein